MKELLEVKSSENSISPQTSVILLNPLSTNSATYELEPIFFRTENGKKIIKSLIKKEDSITIETDKFLNESEFNRKDFEILASGLIHNNKLQNLRIANIQLSSENLGNLLDKLKYRNNFFSLSLYKNQLDREGAKTIAEWLKNNIPLQILDISDNCIEDESLAYFASTFKINRTLQVFNFNKNNISQNKLEAFVNEIMSNFTITSLGSENDIRCSSFINRNVKLCDDMHLAIKQNHINKVEELINKDVSFFPINRYNLFKDSFLYLAVKKGRAEIVKLIIYTMHKKNISLEIMGSKEELSVREFIKNTDLIKFFNENESFDDTTQATSVLTNLNSILLLDNNNVSSCLSYSETEAGKKILNCHQTKIEEISQQIPLLTIDSFNELTAQQLLKDSKGIPQNIDDNNQEASSLSIDTEEQLSFEKFESMMENKTEDFELYQETIIDNEQILFIETDSNKQNGVNIDKIIEDKLTLDLIKVENDIKIKQTVLNSNEHILKQQILSYINIIDEAKEIQSQPSLFEVALVQVENTLAQEQVVHFDFETQKNIINEQELQLEDQKAFNNKQLNHAIQQLEVTQLALLNATQENLALLNEQAINQQQQIDSLKVQQAILLREHEIKQQRKQTLERLQKFPNQWQFYRTIQLQVQKLFIRSISGAGESANGINVSLQGLDLFNDITNIVPIVGPAINVFLKWTIGKLLESLNETRQLNISDQVADLLTLSELKRMSEGVAQRLTYWYEPLLNNIATEIEEKSFRKIKSSTFLGKAKAVAKKAQQSLTKGKQESSAVKMAKFVIAWGLDAISELELEDSIVGNNIITPEKLLENKLVDLITHKKLSEIDKVDVSSLIKLFKQTHKLTEDLVIKLSNFLIKQKVYSNKGEKWPLWRVLSECGIQAKQENLIKVYFVPHAIQMASIFGYCQGTSSAAISRGMIEQLTKTITASENISDNDSNTGLQFSTKANTTQLLTVTMQASQLRQDVERIQKYSNFTTESLKKQNEELSETVKSQSNEITLLKQQQQEIQQQLQHVMSMLNFQSSLSNNQSVSQSTLSTQLKK